MQFAQVPNKTSYENHAWKLRRPFEIESGAATVSTRISGEDEEHNSPSLSVTYLPKTAENQSRNQRTHKNGIPVNITLVGMDETSGDEQKPMKKVEIPEASLERRKRVSLDLIPSQKSIVGSFGKAPPSNCNSSMCIVSRGRTTGLL